MTQGTPRKEKDDGGIERQKEGGGSAEGESMGKTTSSRKVWETQPLASFFQGSAY